ncbi:hypothetical protein [Streptococcus sp. Marseille-Q5855]|uniref:phage upper tail fiber protein n=1 Tax=Streptococcus sp. Marseille-Q5855 TaxID=2972781 RepID=UPI0021CA6BBC|nr:hypothetical protein [Streptococcus sp. Marseille-Q5855]
MSNLENLARAIGEDVKAIKEDSELKDREVKKRLDTLESRPRVHPETLVTKAELEEKGYLTSHQDLSTYAQKWELYNDIPIKARISALENRPSFDTLTPTQRDSLKGDNGHSLNASVRIEGSYKNGSTSQLNLFADVFYDGEAVTSGYTLDYYYRGFGNNSWGVLRNQTPDANGKFGQWNASQRSGGWFEVRIEVNYRGLRASAFTHLDNINDGERGATGAPGQNIVNQNGSQALNYWAGTQAQYDALPTKDPHTIYDIFK